MFITSLPYKKFLRSYIKYNLSIFALFLIVHSQYYFDVGLIPELTGWDKNKNGVRDNIETYINKTYPDKMEKKLLFHQAKIWRDFIINYKDRDKNTENTWADLSFDYCISHHIDKTRRKIFDDIETRVFNTVGRFLARESARQNRDFAGATLPKREKYHEFCDVLEQYN